MAYSDVMNKLGQIKQNNLDLINSQIPPVKGDLMAGKDTKQPGGIPNRPYEAPKEDPNNPYVPAPPRPKLANANKGMMIANQSLTPKDFGPIKLYGVPHIRTPYIKQFEMDNFRRFIKSTTGEDFPLAQNNNSLLIAGDAGTSMMNYVTEKGFFLDGRGKAYMQTEGEFYDAGEYDVDVHGLPVPLAEKQKRRSELQIA